jgi:hypothetical protein
VATNCTNWETRIGITNACSQQVIADHEHGGGRPHWQILEDLGIRIGLKRSSLRNAQPPLPSTQLCRATWEGPMANRHWLEGIVANTCAERTNMPGSGTGLIRKAGWFGLERSRWGKLFGLSENELEFFELHTTPTSSIPTWVGKRSSDSRASSTWGTPWSPPANGICTYGSTT